MRDAVLDRSMLDIVKDIAVTVQEIVICEVRLVQAEFKAELKEEAAKRWTGARLILIGAGIGFLGAIYLVLSAVSALSLVMPAWAAAGSVGLVLAVIGRVLISSGTNKVRQEEP